MFGHFTKNKGDEFTMNINNLKGSKVSVFTTGGWTVSGTVESSSNKELAIITSDGMSYVKRKHIAIINIAHEQNRNKKDANTKPDFSGQLPPDKNFFLFKESKVDNKVNQSNDQGDDLSEGGVYIPHEVLAQSIGDKNSVRSKFAEHSDDLSISMHSLMGGSNKNRISVTTNDESK